MRRAPISAFIRAMPASKPVVLAPMGIFTLRSRPRIFSSAASTLASLSVSLRDLLAAAKWSLISFLTPAVSLKVGGVPNVS